MPVSLSLAGSSQSVTGKKKREIMNFRRETYIFASATSRDRIVSYHRVNEKTAPDSSYGRRGGGGGGTDEKETPFLPSQTDLPVPTFLIFCRPLRSNSCVVTGMEAFQDRS